VMLVSSIIPGFLVSGFWPAFWFAIIFSLINALFGVKYREGRD
jgi:uncharacterized membrane protein YvlD (DUF360 family)